MTKSTQAAVASIKARQTDEDGTVLLKTGVRVRLHPIAAGAITDAQARIHYPRPPMWHNPDKEREEPNYNDPDYLEAVEQVNRDRGNAAIDVTVMLGVELVDGLPEGDRWLDGLRFLEKRGGLDLSDFDFKSDLEREFVYKRYIAVSAEDIATVQTMSGITPQEVDAAADGFPGTA